MSDDDQWAFGFASFGGVHGKARLHAWSVFHHLAASVAPTGAVPPVPPMVLQMLNRASADVGWRLVVDRVTGQATHALYSKKGLKQPLTALSQPNWWHHIVVREFPEPAGFATLPIRPHRLVFDLAPEGSRMPDGLMQTAPCRGLRHVTVFDTQTVSVTDVVSHLPRLAFLMMSGPVTDGDLRAMALKRTLTSVSAGDSKLKSVSCLAVSTSLTSLSLFSSLVTSEGLIGLERIPTLTRLNMETARDVTSVTCLADSTSLRELSLRGSPVTTVGLAGLERIPTLTSLDLTSCSKVTSVSRLGASTSLTSLNLAYSSVTSEGLEGLERIPTLTELNLSYCNALTSVSCLAKSESLRDLNLFKSTMTDVESLEVLRQKPMLRVRGP